MAAKSTTKSTSKAPKSNKPAVLQSRDARLLRLPTVIDRTGFGRSKIYELISRGEFPAPVKVDGCAVWSANRIDAWIGEREAAADAA